MKRRMKMIRIPREEYLQFRKIKNIIDIDLFNKLVKGFEDIKAGRVKEFKPSR